MSAYQILEYAALIAIFVASLVIVLRKLFPRYLRRRAQNSAGKAANDCNDGCASCTGCNMAAATSSSPIQQR